MTYILIGKNPVRVEDTRQWAMWHGWMMRNGGCFIDRDTYPKENPLRKNKRIVRGQRRSSKRVITRINAQRNEPILLSTVFLGVDHSFIGEPVLFETMIFGGKHDGRQWRYTTFDDAIANHKKLKEQL